MRVWSSRQLNDKDPLLNRTIELSQVGEKLVALPQHAWAERRLRIRHALVDKSLLLIHKRDFNNSQIGVATRRIADFSI